MPDAVTCCFLACPNAALAMFVPDSFSDASAFALIAPPAPKPAVMSGASGTCRLYGPKFADLPRCVLNVFERSPPEAGISPSSASLPNFSALMTIGSSASSSSVFSPPAGAGSGSRARIGPHSSRAEEVGSGSPAAPAPRAQLVNA